MNDRVSMIRTERYAPTHKAAWDGFVVSAKNASFLFFRDYVDYHRDRFADHSIMLFRGDVLVAVMPANLAADGTLVSHEGLTYGGLAVSASASLCDVLSYFHAVLQYLKNQNINRLLYKRFPAFYNVMPDDDVGYALFLLEATLYRRDCALVIVTSNRLPFRKGRRSQIQRAKRANVRVVEESSFLPFWQQILVPRLADRYGSVPVHSAEEIALLASHFPENIKQYSAYVDGAIVAGTTVFETPRVMHAQYIAASEEGLKIGALDLLFSWLIDDRYKGKYYIDFGTCNGKDGRALNFGLLDWKESFGGRCYSHDFYEIRTGSLDRLAHVLDGRPEALSES